MIIVDASVALKWIWEEDGSSDAEQILKSHISNKEAVTIPPLLYFEVANALVTKTRTSSLTIRKGLQNLYNAKFEVYLPNEEEVVTSAVLSKRYRTSFYDMLYAVIAKRLKTILVTADVNFVKRTKFRHVKLLSQY